MFTLTDYAMKRSGKLHGMPNVVRRQIFEADRRRDLVHNPAMWDNLDAQFLKHLGSVNKTLKEHNLPELKE